MGRCPMEQNPDLVCCQLGCTHHTHEAPMTCCRANLAFDVEAVTCSANTVFLYATSAPYTRQAKRPALHSWQAEDAA